MPEELETRYVFVDTSMYESKNYQFHQHALGRFKGLCSEQNLYLLMSPVIDGEITSHLAEKAHEAAKHVKEFKKTIKVLRNLPDLKHHGIFEELTKSDTEKLLLEKYAEFKDEAVHEWVDIDLAKPSVVTEHYFKKTPPFSGKKKDEFPDALMLISLLEWAKQKNARVYILSKDGDMDSFCNTSDGWLEAVSDLDGFINLVINNDEELKDLAKFANDRFGECLDEITRSLEESINDLEYSTSGYDIDDEVTDVNAYDLEIVDTNIIKADREYAEFSLTVKFAVEAWHSLTDYDRSIWDSEDKKYLFTAQTSRKVRDIVTCKAYAWIDFEDGLAVNTALNEVYIEDSYIELDPDNGELIEIEEHELFDE
ncbi:PIN domain-containing protein [Microbulbifer sp. DLAB2-AF]|uniref:PIN domain-containing protein n=1 Tax=Microbulbifer sp. DLAB2-AF TaxID=3243395 RepID=UPI004039DD9C